MYAVQVRGSGIKGSGLQEESGTETHKPITESPQVTEMEGKKARAAARIAKAAAQRQPLARVPVPNVADRAVPGNRIKTQ